MDVTGLLWFLGLCYTHGFVVVKFLCVLASLSHGANMLQSLSSVSFALFSIQSFSCTVLIWHIDFIYWRLQWHFHTCATLCVDQVSCLRRFHVLVLVAESSILFWHTRWVVAALVTALCRRRWEVTSLSTAPLLGNQPCHSLLLL
jgi:hypothetical protein